MQHQKVKKSMKFVIVGLMLSFGVSSYASVAKHVSQTSLSGQALNSGVLEKIEAALANMENSAKKNWASLNTSVNSIVTNTGIAASTLNMTQDSDSSIIGASQAIYAQNFVPIKSRGSGTISYDKAVSTIMCQGAKKSIICGKSTNDKQLNNSLLSSTILSFTSADISMPSAYIGNLVGYGAGNYSNKTDSLSSILSQQAATSMSIQALLHIANQNQTDSKGNYHTKYQLVHEMVDQFLQSQLVGNIPSEKKLINVLKANFGANTLNMMSQSLLTEQVQTGNALSASINAQLAQIQKQNQKIIAQNKKRNQLLQQLVDSGAKGNK